MDAFREFHLNDIEVLENPTGENLARWTWEPLSGPLPMRKVVIRETCTSGVEYRGPDCE